MEITGGISCSREEIKTKKNPKKILNTKHFPNLA